MLNAIFTLIVYSLFGALRDTVKLIKKGYYACAWVNFNTSLCSLWLIVPILILVHTYFGFIVTVIAGIVIFLAMLISNICLIDKTINTLTEETDN